MATKPVKGIKIKDGRLVRTRPYKDRNKELKAARLAKAWANKTPASKSGG
jgi:hypothetical protein